MKKTPGEGSGLLYESLLRLESVDECRRFLRSEERRVGKECL